jgi:hypothetical protein
MKQPAKEIDLHEYDNPIKRVDGQVPYNGYLWPTEAWWPGHQPEFRNRIRGQWHFGIVALIDGRFAVDGTVSHINADSETPYRRENEPEGRRVVFATRQAAIRVAAARMIGDIRRLRHSTRLGVWGHMDRATMADVINWTRASVASACNEAPPAPIALQEPPPHPAPRPEAGLPLFEMKPNAPALPPQRSGGRQEQVVGHGSGGL